MQVQHLHWVFHLILSMHVFTLSISFYDLHAGIYTEKFILLSPCTYLHGVFHFIISFHVFTLIVSFYHLNAHIYTEYFILFSPCTYLHCVFHSIISMHVFIWLFFLFQERVIIGPSTRTTWKILREGISGVDKQDAVRVTIEQLIHHKMTRLPRGYILQWLECQWKNITPWLKDHMAPCQQGYSKTPRFRDNGHGNSQPPCSRGNNHPPCSRDNNQT